MYNKFTMHKANYVKNALLPALIIMLLFSCAKRQAVKPSGPGLPAVEGPVTVERLIGSLLYNKVKSIRSAVNVTAMKEGKTKGRFKGALVYGSPGSIRLRAFDPFGETVMDMVKSGSMIQVYMPQNNTVYEGWTPPLGIPPDALFAKEEEGDSYILHVFRPDHDTEDPKTFSLISKYFLDRRTLLNRRIIIYSHGKKFMEIHLNNHSGHVPGRMQLSFFNGFSLDMDLEEPLVDSALPSEIFRSIPQEGKRIKPMKALFSDFKL